MTDCVYTPVETIADQIRIYLDEYITSLRSQTAPMQWA
jgi:hypothetical protein